MKQYNGICIINKIVEYLAIYAYNNVYTHIAINFISWCWYQILSKIHLCTLAFMNHHALLVRRFRRILCLGRIINSLGAGFQNAQDSKSLNPENFQRQKVTFSEVDFQNSNGEFRTL